MWTKNKRHPMMAALRVDWHLVPPPNKGEGRMPDIEWADLDSLTWDETYGPRILPSPDEHAEPEKSAIIDLPPRAYSLLSGILSVLVFIAALMLFRH
jgi:hypothetical protein